MWEPSKFEERMRVALESELGETEGQSVFGQYTGARTILLEEVLNEIRGTQPYLTDHGPEHIRNVLDNVELLLGDQSTHFGARELYLLGLSVLLHDVGNLESRNQHNTRIAKYYNYARPGEPQRTAPEKRLVIAAAKAHTGKNAEGGRDTLQDVPEVQYFHRTQVKLRDIATVVRFADELAEGPQRTSHFLQSQGKYAPDSAIHHRYAAVTDVAIDRNLRRISLCYNIVLQGTTQQVDRFVELRELLDYIYKRATKLDEERKYARFYCPELLVPFREILMHIDITDGESFELGVEPVSFSDKVVPEGQTDVLGRIAKASLPEEIVVQVKSKLAAHETGVSSDSSTAGC